MEVGDIIPVFTQAAAYGPPQFPRATVTDMQGNLVGLFDLSPDDSKGSYSNYNAIMPDSPWVRVKILAYDDSAHTILSSSLGGTDYEVYLGNGISEGDIIPLFTQAANYDSSQFPLAIITDNEGHTIATVPLPFDSATGSYSSYSVVMPNVPWVRIRIDVYQDSGHTILSTSLGGFDYVVYQQSPNNAFPFLTNIVAVINPANCTDCSQGIIQDTLVQGSDRTLSVRLQNECGIPFDLTDTSLIQFRFRNADGTTLIIQSTDLNLPVRIMNVGGGAVLCVITATQSLLLAPGIPAPFTILITGPQGTIAVNCPTQLAIEEQEV